MKLISDENWDVLYNVGMLDDKARMHLFNPKQWERIQKKVEDLTLKYKSEKSQSELRDVINGKSKYIYVVDGASGLPAQIRTSATDGIYPIQLSGGADSATNFTATQDEIEKGWDLFRDRTKSSPTILIDCLRRPCIVRPKSHPSRSTAIVPI
jgi:hypothetical protein